MGMSKTAIAAVMGIDLTPPPHLAAINTKSQSMKPPQIGPNGETIGQAIIRRAAYGKVTPQSIQRYLEALRECGIIARAALAAGLSYSSIAKLREGDRDFVLLEEEMKQLWIAEKIDEPFRRIGIDGEPKYGINQKTGTRIQIGIERSPQIALAFARKFDPAYREKQEVDVNHGGQVVVVTAKVTDLDMEAYARKIENENSHDMLDVHAKSLPADGHERSLPSPAALPSVAQPPGEQK